jgi:hypothetical protein
LILGGNKMIPSVKLPTNKIKIPVEVKLKPGWKFDSSRRRFESAKGEKFAPRGDLPKHSKLVYKIPSLARADTSKLSKPERDLQRYIQVILPKGQSAADYVEVIREWPSVAEAHVAPEVSLPKMSG